MIDESGENYLGLLRSNDIKAYRQKIRRFVDRISTWCQAEYLNHSYTRCKNVTLH